MTTSHIDTGVTGAKRQSWKPDNPRELLMRLIKKNPTMGVEELQDVFWDAVQRHRQVLRTVSDYWVDNHHRYLHRAATAAYSGTKKKTATAPQLATGTIAAAMEAKFEQHVDARVQIILRDMMLPSGKTLGQSNREEILEWGGEANRFAQRLGARLAPGQVLNDSDLPDSELTALYVAE